MAFRSGAGSANILIELVRSLPTLTRRNTDVTRIFRYLPMIFQLLFCIQFADAQSSFDVNVGFGAAQDKSLGTVDINTLNPCTTGSVACGKTASLSNFMLGFGANLMLWNHFGVGGDVSIQPARQDYLVFQPAVSSTGQVG